MKKILIFIFSLLLLIGATSIVNKSYAQQFGQQYEPRCWSAKRDCDNFIDKTKKCSQNDAGEWCTEVVVRQGGSRTTTETNNSGTIIGNIQDNCVHGFSPSVSDDRKSCVCKATFVDSGSCTNENGRALGCNAGYVPTLDDGGNCSCLAPSNPGTCGVTVKDLNLSGNCGTGFITTAIGCIPVRSTGDFVNWFLRWAIGISGGIAFLLIVTASFQIMTASGDPQRLQGGRELLTAAISGLILIIFSVFLLRLIGVTILQIPGL